MRNTLIESVCNPVLSLKRKRDEVKERWRAREKGPHINLIHQTKGKLNSSSGSVTSIAVCRLDEKDINARIIRFHFAKTHRAFGMP